MSPLGSLRCRHRRKATMSGLRSEPQAAGGRSRSVYVPGVGDGPDYSLSLTTNLLRV